jgi:hypothetical protein
LSRQVALYPLCVGASRALSSLQPVGNLGPSAALGTARTGELGFTAGDCARAAIFRGGFSCQGRRAAAVQIEKEQVAGPGARRELELSQPGIPRFQGVTEGLYRGGRKCTSGVLRAPLGSASTKQGECAASANIQAQASRPEKSGGRRSPANYSAHWLRGLDPARQDQRSRGAGS